VYHRVQCEAYLRACSGVRLIASCALVWECTVKQADCVPSSASVSVHGSMPGSVLENILGGVLGSVFAVYLEASSAISWEVKSSRLGVYN